MPIKSSYTLTSRQFLRKQLISHDSFRKAKRSDLNQRNRSYNDDDDDNDQDNGSSMDDSDSDISRDSSGSNDNRSVPIGQEKSNHGSNFYYLEDDPNQAKQIPSNNSVETKPTSSKKKRVSFNGRALVVLIPTIAEYNNAGLGDKIWWNRDDFKVIHSSVTEDIRLIRHLLHNNAFTSCKQLMDAYIKELLDLADTDQKDYMHDLNKK